MNFKTTIILLVLLAVVGGVVWFTGGNDKKAEQANSSPGGAGQKLVDLSADHVNKLTIADAAGNRTTIVKDGSAWKMTEPVAAGAQEYTARDLISSLTDLRSQGKPDSDPGSASGLEKPRYTISLTGDDGKTSVIKLGEKTGVGDVMYAQVEGSGDIYLVPSTLEKSLKTVADDVRDKHLVTARDGQIQQVKISYEGKTIELKKLLGKWEILGSQLMPGDETAISSLLFSITGMEGTEFIKPGADDVTFARFNHPTMTVWYSTQPAATQPSGAAAGAGEGTLTFGAPDGFAKDHYFVQTSDGLIAKVAKYSFDGLHKTALELRDKDVATILPADVTRISIAKQTFAPASTQPVMGPTTQPAALPKPVGTTTVVLVKRPAPTTSPSTQATTMASTQPAPEQSAWMIEGDSKTAVDDAKVAALLAKFDPLHADKFDEVAPAGGLASHYTLQVTTQQAGGGMTAVYPFEFSVYADTTVSPIGLYNGTMFDVPKTTMDPFDADFAKK